VLGYQDGRALGLDFRYEAGGLSFERRDQFDFHASVQIQQPLIFVMNPDPEPVECGIFQQGKGSIPAANPERPDIAGFLELK